ncbi:septum formation initiator family protein [Streptomyces sp. ACA25]|nr:septum formation initiator family protein [Streptomyces sp. ACA25]MDB1089871.1 septum formation initiator family protein [Streptomyces sp. ACA25]
MVPTGTSTAARTPFVLLIVVLLGSGMLALLLLNASLNQGSFELSELRRETQELTDEQQALQAEVDAFSAPAALAERARELGLVPGGPPAFLGPDGTVLGEPAPAPEPEEQEAEEPEEGPEDGARDEGPVGPDPSSGPAGAGEAAGPDGSGGVDPDPGTEGPDEEPGEEEEGGR